MSPQNAPLRDVLYKNFLSMNILDETDIAILQILQTNSAYTTKELAAMIHLSPTPTYERVKRLEREGIITKYAAILDADRLNMGFTVYCLVKMKHLDAPVAKEFRDVVNSIPEVTECYNISGQFDFLLRINAPDMEYYRNFALDIVGRVEAIGSIESSFVMSQVKRTHEIPLPESGKY